MYRPPGCRNQKYLATMDHTDFMEALRNAGKKRWRTCAAGRSGLLEAMQVDAEALCGPCLPSRSLESLSPCRFGIWFCLAWIDGGGVLMQGRCRARSIRRRMPSFPEERALLLSSPFPVFSEQGGILGVVEV